jgi:twinkle protein
MDVVAKLAEQGITLRRVTVGTDLRAKCPKCEGGTSREDSLSVKIDPDGGATWHCFRATCGWKGGVSGTMKLNTWKPPSEKAYRKPEPPVEPKCPNVLYDWFEMDRGISRKTVDAFKIYLTPRRFGSEEVSCVSFPYFSGGELVSVKYRTKDKRFQQEAGTQPSLYNIDNLIHDRVVIVEGELDCMALHEAGIHGAISFRDGVPSAGTDLENAKLYDALRTHAGVLKDVTHFVLAGDADGVGKAHQLELARRLGKERCRLVTWPEDCKDANDTLLRYGAEAVQEAIENAAPMPIEGLWNVAEDDILALDDDSWQRTVATGCEPLDKLFQVPQVGRFFVVTGIPGMGKSTFCDWLACTLAAKHGWRTVIFSPETAPWQLQAQRWARIYMGKPWKEFSIDEKLKAIRFVGSHLTHIADEGEHSNYTVKYLLEQVRLAVLRDGVKIVILDPWNEIEQGRPSHVTQTEWTNTLLPQLKRLCAAHGVNVFLVVHPRKMQDDEIPTGYSISDSAAFANKADFGVTIHQTKDELTQQSRVMVRLWKVRFQAHGQKGDGLLEWDPRSNRFDKVGGDFSGMGKPEA